MRGLDLETARRVTCETCDGEGEIRKTSRSRTWVICPECGGEGVVADPGPIVELEDPAPSRKGE